MPTVFGYHDVKGTEHWLASPKREEFFGPLGVTNFASSSIRRSRRGSASRWVFPTWTRSWRRWSEGAAEATAFDGVLPETLVILVER